MTSHLNHKSVGKVGLVRSSAEDIRILAIDLSTEGCKAAVFDADGNSMAAAFTAYPTNFPHPGWAEQDPRQWWSALSADMNAIGSQLGTQHVQVDAVGVCGQMHAPVPIDRQGHVVVHRVPLWSDKRSTEEAIEMEEKVGLDELIRITGNPPTPAWTAPKMLWMRKHISDYRSIFKVLLPKDYLTFKLTGEPLTDWSEASGTMLYSWRQSNWSSMLCDVFDLDADILPDIFRSSELIGEVSHAASIELGIPSGTPVVAGGGDFLCAVLGSSVASPGTGVEITGTAALIATYAKEPVLDPAVMNLHHVTDGWVPFGILDSGGAVLNWLINNFGEGVKEEAKQKNVSPYAVIDEEASKVPPGSDGLIALPSFMGERTFGVGQARGSITGLTLSHTRGHVARGLMEGVCFGLRRYLEQIEKSGAGVDEIRLGGGGANSNLWQSIKANVYAKRCLVLRESELSLTGVLVLTGVGAKLFNDPLKAAARLNEVKSTIDPDPRLVQTYSDSYSTYRELHDLLQPYFTRSANYVPSYSNAYFGAVRKKARAAS